ncbi:MAG: cytochrome c3 family protein [Planctomycetota bacterium]
MRFPFLTGLVLGALLTLGGYAALTRTDPERSVPAPLREGFAGSASCAQCHPDLHGRWSASAHCLSIRDFSEETTAKPFDGEIFLARDIEHRMGPGAVMECEGPDGTMQKYPVERVIGVRRIQMFTTSMDRGRIQVLPVFLEVPAKRWFDFTDFIFGKPLNFELGPADDWHSFGRNFNSRCIVCHAVDYDVGYDPDTGVYDTTWKELTVGCESCHGPAQAHVDFHEQKREGEDPIVNPAQLSGERSDMVCGQCHAEADHVDPKFRPGGDLFAAIDPAGLEDAKHLYPDGRARELIHNLLPTKMSRCGPMTCSTCHDPHGRGTPGLMRFEVDDDRMCTQCHEDTKPHTHHKPESPGSRCVNCHMPRMVIEGGHGKVYDHTISIPSMVNTKKHGAPNACQICHLLEDPGWEYEHFARQYPGAEERNHRVRLAEAVAAGRARKPGAVPPLRELAKDDNEVYRAGAVRLLAGCGENVTSFLKDESALVQRAAIEGAMPEALVSLLKSDNPVLRYRAALKLAEHRDNKTTRALAIPVLERFGEVRPDQVAIHMALARLYEAAGDRNRAVVSYERYLRINPWDTAVQRHLDRLKR